MVESVTWVARLVAPEQLAGVVVMAEALGLAVLATTDAQVVLRTDRGDVLEYCTPAHPVPEYLFAGQDTVIGFLIDDVDAAARRLVVQGFAVLAPAQDSGPVRFQHFRGADGLVYGVVAPVVPTSEVGPTAPA